VITDYSMPEMDGVQLVQGIRERDESLPVILLTAHGSERVAVRAMKSGRLRVRHQAVRDRRDLAGDRSGGGSACPASAEPRLSAEKAIGRSIVGESPAMRRLLDVVNRIAPKDITALVRATPGPARS